MTATNDASGVLDARVWSRSLGATRPTRVFSSLTLMRPLTSLDAEGSQESG